MINKLTAIEEEAEASANNCFSIVDKVCEEKGVKGVRVLTKDQLYRFLIEMTADLYEANSGNENRDLVTAYVRLTMNKLKAKLIESGIFSDK